MRLTEFPLVLEVKEEYMDLRRDGKNRTQATEDLIRGYADEITLAPEDDGPLFWIGLADGQYAAKELTTEIAEKGLAAIQQLRKQFPEITVGDLDRRKERYANAPMPERKIRKTNKFRCPWNVGDTYAYQISGTEAEQIGIAGKFMLFCKVDEREFDKGRIMPIVTASLWDNRPFPKTTQEFQSVPFLKVNRGRFSSPKSKHEYRVLIIFNHFKQLSTTPLQFVGNFQNVAMPSDEVIFQDGGHYTLLPPHMIDYRCCNFWESHNYYLNNPANG